MTEAVSDYKALEAMNGASKENCCLVFWATNRPSALSIPNGQAKKQPIKQ